MKRQINALDVATKRRQQPLAVQRRQLRLFPCTNFGLAIMPCAV